MIALQIRGPISSATQIRGDSIGKHLVEITTANESGGTIDGVCLYDLDADYCVGSIVHCGNDNIWESINGLYISGIRGRSSTYLCYDNTSQDSYDITTLNEELVEYCGIISISQKTHVIGGNIITNQNILLGKNPLDSASSYRTPEVIFSAKSNNDIQGVIFYLIGDNYRDTDITKKFINEKIKSFSYNVNNISITLKTYKEEIFYNKDGVDNKTYLKMSPKEEVLEE